MTAAKERDFVTVEELSQGFSEYSLPEVKDLTGKNIILYYEDGRRASYEFVSDKILKYTCGQGEEAQTIAAIYSIVSPRKHIYLLDFIYSYGDTYSMTTVLDLAQNIATTAVGTLPTKEQVQISQFERGDKNLPLTSVNVDFLHASVNKPFTFDCPKHDYSSDLVGERVQFIYSANDVYEHIYLNDKFYTWHCLKGIEKGLCDTDRCYYLKLADELYWFIWLERIVPTIGCVLEDFEAMRSYGKIYGYESYEMGRVTNFPVGSYAKILNVTKYAFE
jgi:hypothetical protein